MRWAWDRDEVSAVRSVMQFEICYSVVAPSGDCVYSCQAGWRKQGGDDD